MSATLTTSPPAIAHSKDPIWVKLQSDLINQNFAKFTIAISSATNNADETITIGWGSTELIFTIKSTPDNSGLQLPSYTGGDLDAYAASIAEAFRQNELLHTDFWVLQTASLGGLKYIYLTARVSGVLDISGSTTITNFAMTPITDGVPDVSEDNLRAVLEVWNESTEPHLDTLLLKSHAPYDYATAEALFDISPAFVALEPFLPPASSIPDLDGAFTWAKGTATGGWLTYFLRYADKYGIPAVAEALVKSGSFVVFPGSESPAAITDYNTAQVRHAYVREDGTTFFKPVGMDQPDWLYWWSGAASGATFTQSVQLTWDDGTVAETTGSNFIISPNTLYYFPVGPRAFQLELATPPSAGAQIVSYRFSIVDTSSDTYWLNVYFEIKNACHEWGQVLLFDNGLGGTETVWLDGKSSQSYEVAGKDIYRMVRTPDFNLEDGEFSAMSATGQTVWQASTGWFDDPAYLLHLRQLPLSSAAWLVDSVNGRFLRVLIEGKTLESVKQDDLDLYALTFTIRAAWLDLAINH